MPSNATSRLLMPLLLAAGVGSAQAQTVQWTKGPNTPANAVDTGGSPAGKVCRLMVDGQVIPGELVGDTCTVPGASGSVAKTDSFDVLIGPGTLVWVQDAGRDPRSYPRGSQVPEGAVTGGSYQGQPAYVCRANGHVGRLVSGICTSVVQGQVSNHTLYEVLANRTLRGGNTSAFGAATSRNPQGTRAAATPAPPGSTPLPPATPTPPTPPGSTPMPPTTPTPPTSTPLPPVNPTPPTPPTSTPGPGGTPAPPASPVPPTSSGN